MKRLSVVGLGYIGLPTAVHAAQNGYDVIGYDVDEEKIKKITEGIAPIQEEGLEVRLKEVLQAKTFVAYSNITSADFFLIAVPTPFKKDKQPDLSYVDSAIESIATVLETQNTIILESTVPIGTTEKIAATLEERTGLQAGIDFYVAHCPERILPGNTFNELVFNDRIIGGITSESSEKAVEFYTPLVKSSLFVTDDKTAEMVKLVENSSRDVAIAFANQIAAIAVENGINPHELIALANKHPRVEILNPGIGVGGHCIAVDPWFIISHHPEQSGLLKQARLINDLQPQKIFNQIVMTVERLRQEEKYQNRLIKVGILGVTYKPDVDDVREAPAVQIIQMLRHNKQIELLLCEPNISQEQAEALGFAQNLGLWQTVSQVDVAVILVAHKEFYSLRSSDMQQALFIDPTGLFYKIASLEKNVGSESNVVYQAGSISQKQV